MILGVTEMLAFEMSGYNELHTLQVLRIAYTITPKELRTPKCANLCTGASFLPMFLLLFGKSSSNINMGSCRSQTPLNTTFHSQLVPFPRTLHKTFFTAQGSQTSWKKSPLGSVLMCSNYNCKWTVNFNMLS